MEAVLLGRLIIPGRMPGLNDYIAAERSNRYMAAKMKHEWQQTVCHEIRRQWRGLKFDEPIFLGYKFYEANKRRDHDNVAGFAHKVVQDAMVQMEVIRDDGWDYISGFIDWFQVDKKEPHIVIDVMRGDDLTDWEVH